MEPSGLKERSSLTSFRGVATLYPKLYGSTSGGRIGNANPTSAHRDDGLLFQVGCVARQQVGDERNTAFGGYVRQMDQTTARNILHENELAEIAVNGDEDAPLVGGDPQ